MTDSALLAALAQSVTQVLETMCFSSGSAIPPTARATEVAKITLPFRGSYSGFLHLSVELAAARALTSQFLGHEDVKVTSASEVDGTVRELGKVICGHFLSGLDPAGRLMILPACSGTEALNESLEQTFRIPAGHLRVAIQFD
jgi:hypothetical protein